MFLNRSITSVIGLQLSLAAMGAAQDSTILQNTPRNKFHPIPNVPACMTAAVQ